MRGEGINCHQEFEDFHLIGSVSFPHGWINRNNYFDALQRFKNLDDKVVIVFSENERKGTNVAKVLGEKGFRNVYLLSGGI
jgi:rhodanese-related sulfurtransferase